MTPPGAFVQPHEPVTKHSYASPSARVQSSAHNQSSRCSQSKILTFFLFVGDNHYADSGDLGTLRWYYKWSRAISDRAAFIAHTPILATWDDHDFTGNNHDGTSPGKAMALRAFTEYWVNPSYGTDTTPGVFHHSTWGDVDLFLLDDRYYRGLDGSLLGPGQTEWLLEKLGQSNATVKLIVSGSQWTLEGTSDSWKVFESARAEPV